MNIILYGLRGTGKSTVGRLLAKKLNRQFVDLDKERLKKFGQTTEEVVRQGSWPLFRQQEKEVTREIAANFDNAIIAAGGGTLMDEENAAVLKKNGKAVLLVADVPVMVERISRRKNNTNRPSLTGGKSPEEEVEDVWNERKDRYLELADLVIDANSENLQPKVEKIIQHFNLK
jgi:shikimate kinase